MQNCADGRFRRAQTLPAIDPGAWATERGQRPELSQRTSGTPLVQGPAMGAGPARATGAKGRTRATPAPAPSQPGKHQPGFIWRHVRLKNAACPTKTSRRIRQAKEDSLSTVLRVRLKAHGRKAADGSNRPGSPTNS